MRRQDGNALAAHHALAAFRAIEVSSNTRTARGGGQCAEPVRSEKPQKPLKARTCVADENCTAAGRYPPNGTDEGARADCIYEINVPKINNNL
jgi:hypothetical protein